ncbi:MAG: carboxylesterase/lipase family protein [Micrococcaceae bacterium]
MYETKDLSKWQVKTSEGTVQGIPENRVICWRGLRYAKPPIADLRFRDPQPPEKFAGIYQAAKFGDMPPQAESIFTVDSPAIEEAREDSLFLNIWSPKADNKKRPVMVWIYGGAYAAGNSADPMFNGESLAHNGDTVVVTFNYRLNLLGYIHFGDIAKEHGIEGFDNNLGLKDQVAALRWVKKNISVFGGDPNNITIFGESAGGAAVTALLTTPTAKGLFHKAIAESPTIGAITSKEKAKKYALDVLEELHIKPENLADLKAIPTDNLITAGQNLVQKNLFAEPGSLIYCCLIDEFLPEHPILAVKYGHIQKDIPLIIGTNSDEASVFSLGRYPLLPTRTTLAKALLRRVANDVKTEITASYPDYPKRSAILDLATDWIFRMPVIWFAENYAEHAPVWMYEFQYASPFLTMTGFGSVHTGEIPFIMHNYDAGQAKMIVGMTPKYTTELLGLKMQQTWIRFAKKGDPNPNSVYRNIERHEISLKDIELDTDNSFYRVQGKSDADIVNSQHEINDFNKIRQNLASTILNFQRGRSRVVKEDKKVNESLNLFKNFPNLRFTPDRKVSLPNLERAVSQAKNTINNINLQESIESLQHISLQDSLDNLQKNLNIQESLQNINLHSLRELLSSDNDKEIDIENPQDWKPWPKYDEANRIVRVINIKDSLVLDPGKESRKAWNKIFNRLFIDESIF